MFFLVVFGGCQGVAICSCYDFARWLIGGFSGCHLQECYYTSQFYLYSSFHNTQCFKADSEKIIILMFIVPYLPYSPHLAV